MDTDWASVPVGELLRKSEEWIEIEPEATYKEVTVRLWGKGVVQRRLAKGSEIAAQWRNVVRANQFIVSRIDARHGALGLIPHALDGAVVSTDFPAFSLNEAKMLPAFLDWLSKTQGFINICKAASVGTTNRIRLKEEKFLAMKLPLPLVSEQQRIVGRIEELSVKITEAHGLRQQTVEETNALLPVTFGEFFRSLATKFPVEPLGKLASRISDGPHKKPNYVSRGIPFVTVRNMVTGRLNFDNVQYITPEDHEEFSKRCNPQRGDVLYSKDGATKGCPCFVDTDQDFNIFVSVALIKPLRDKLDGLYLCHLLNSSWIKDRMRERSRGDMIPHIVLGEIREFPVPIPPLEEQRRIVQQLNELKSQVDSVKRLQSQTAAELDAMLPAVLDQAFKGEL